MNLSGKHHNSLNDYLKQHQPAFISHYVEEYEIEDELVERIVDRYRAFGTADMAPGFHWDALAHNPG